MSIVFTFDLTCLAFFILGEVGLFHWLEACLVSGSYAWHQLLSPVMTLERKFGSLSIWFFNSWHKVKRVFFWSCVSRWGTNFAATRLMFKSTVKIRWQEPQLTPVASEISSFVYWRSSLIFSQIFSAFSSVRFVDRRPEWGWSSTLISPLLNRANHSKTCVRLSASSLKAFWNISCASVAVFPRRKQNLKQIRCSVRSDITISQEELDNTRENSQHKPVRPSTETSAWLLTREGCNYTHLAAEHSTTIRKSSPKPVRFFFWVPPRMQRRT